MIVDKDTELVSGTSNSFPVGEKKNIILTK